MNRFRRFMSGRYGFDQYTRALIIIALVLSLAAALTGNRPLVLISYIPALYAIFRILSRNINRRSQENFTYCEMMRKLKNSWKNFMLLMVGTKTHKYYRCRKCRQMLRVPRGKGKISISCPKCRTEFIKRT